MYKVECNLSFGLIIDILMYIYPTRKEKQHIEVINSQEDHKQWTSFVFISSKVYQLLLQYTSFATRGPKCVKENWP